MAKKDLLRGEARTAKIKQVRSLIEETNIHAPRIYCIQRRRSSGRAYPTRSFDVYCIAYRAGDKGIKVPYLQYLNGDIAALINVRRNRHREIVINGGGFSAEQEIAGLLSMVLYGDSASIAYEKL